MATIAKLLVALGLDAADYSEGLASATDEASNFGSKLNDFITTGAVVAGGAAVAGLAVVGKAAYDLANDVQNNQNDLVANLGVTADRAAELGQLGVDIWKNNWGNNIEEVNGAITETQKQFARLGGIADDQTDKIVTGAFAIRDTFGVDVNETISAQRTLMEQFGLTAQEATDFITSGFQEGLNSSDDFLETIGEYSNLFAQGGADAGAFFSLMETGTGSGVLGTDKAADAFKEFSIRIREGSSDTLGSLKNLGIDVEDFYDKFDSGKMTVADAFTLVQDKLRATDDLVTQNWAGVGLFGTQWEDLGPQMATSMTLVNTTLDDLAGSTDTLNAKYNNWPSLWEGIKRSAVAALLPLGNKLLEISNSLMPQVTTAFNWIGTNLPIIIDQAVQGFDTFKTTLTDVYNLISPYIPTIQELIPIVAGLVAAFAAFSVISSVVGVITSIVAAFSGLGTVSAVLGTIVGILGGPVTITIGLVAIAIGVLTAAWNGNWGDIQGKTAAVWNFIEPIFNAVKDWLADKLTSAIQTLSDFWTGTLWPAIQVVANWVQSTLFPILKTLAEDYIKIVTNVARLLAEVFTNVVMPGLRIVADYIGDKLQPVFEGISDFIRTYIIPGFQLLADKLEGPLTSAGNTANGVFEAISSSISTISDVISGVISWVQKFIDKLDSIHVPEILTQHSPSILEQAIIDVNKQFTIGSQLAPDFNEALQRIRVPHVEGGATSTHHTDVKIDARGADKGVADRITTALTEFSKTQGKDSSIRIRLGSVGKV